MAIGELDCSMGGEIEGEKSVLGVRAPGLGTVKGWEAVPGVGGGLQPSAA